MVHIFALPLPSYMARFLVFCIAFLAVGSISQFTSAAPADGIVTWSDVDKDSNITLANNNLDALISESAGPNLYGLRSTGAISPGDGFFYFELEQLQAQYGFAIGIATADVPLTTTDDLETFIANNPEMGVTSDVYVGVVGIAVDYRGATPTIHFIGNDIFEQTPESVASITPERNLTVTEPIYIYVIAASGAQYRLNFGGDNGADFGWDPISVLGSRIYNLESVLEYGWPVSQAKPSVAITEGNQLVAQDASLTFHATASDALANDLSSNVNWYLDGVAIGSGSSISPATSTPGIYQLSAQVTDAIGLTSSISVGFYVHPSVGGDTLDQDQDGLTYTEELAAGTDPANHDSDADGLSDGYEVDNGTDPLVVNTPIGIEAHQDDVKFVFEATKTSNIVTTSDDGLSVSYLPVGGKAAIRANQGMKGEFRYWEGHALFDADMGFGLINPDEKIDDYCCVTAAPDFSDPEAPGASMSVNMLLGNTIWRNLVFQGLFANNDEYIGYAVDYRTDDPIVYVIGSSGLQMYMTLDDYPSADAIFPMVYGNAGEVEDFSRLAAAVQRGNFGQEPFFYDVETILATATDEGTPLNIDVSDLVPGWGKYRQRQFLNIDTLSTDVLPGAELTFNASAGDQEGNDQTAAITWTILDESGTDVTSDLATVAPPVTGGSMTFTPLTAEVFTVNANIVDAQTGQVFTRTATVNSDDSEAPTISNQADIQIATFGDSVSASYSVLSAFLNSATASDNSTIVTVTHNAPAVFPVGTTTVTFTATDAAGNTAEDTADVTIVKGALVAPSDLSLNTDETGIAASNAQIQNFLNGTTVTEGVLVSNQSNDAPSFFALSDGTITVTFTATDAMGEEAIPVNAKVNLTDIGSPQVSAPADLSLSTFGSSVPATYTAISDFLVGAVASDNSGQVTVTREGVPSSFGVGDTVVTFIATDATGNTATDTAVVTVTQGALIAPSNLSLATDETGIPTSDTRIQNFLSSTSVTNGVSVASESHDAPSSFNLSDGTVTVTFTATDTLGNNATPVSATLTVTDSGAPQITAPSPISLSTFGSSVSSSYQAIADFLAGSNTSDNSGGNISVTHNAPANFAAGTPVTVTFTAEDQAGNQNTATSTVTITQENLIAPAAVQVPTEAGSVSKSNVSIANFLAAAVVPEGVNIVGDITNNAPDNFALGETVTIEFSATDVTGTTGTATSTISIIDAGDPTITAPTNISLSTFGDSLPASYAPISAFLSGATAEDNSGLVPTITHNAPTEFPVGAPVIVTFTAEDGEGNTTSTTATITVTQGALVAPASINVPVESNSTTSANPLIATFLAGAITTESVTIQSQSNNAPTIFNLGAPVDVIFSATDAAGYSSSATSTVTLVDVGAPTITAPANITLNTFGNSLAATVPEIVAFLNGATATDGSGADVIITHDAPTIFSVGTPTVVTFTGADPSGNRVSTTATVRVNNGTLVPPADIRIATLESSLNQTHLGISSFLSGVSTTSSVAIDTISNDAPASFERGTSTLVTFTATDAYANTASTTATVTIVIDNPPSIYLSATQYTLEASDAQGLALTSSEMVSLINTVTANDIEDGVLAVSNNAPNSLPIGITGVTFSAVDSAGNRSERNALIRVIAQLGDEDSDGDGQSDAFEGTDDGDNDGIPNYLDTSIEPTELPIDNAGRVIKAPDGIQLVLGTAAFSAGSSDATITLEDVMDFGDGGSAVINGDDSGKFFPSGIIDFEIRNMTPGEMVSIVIPQATAIPANAVYRKYTPDSGWQDFDISQGDAVASAPMFADECPAIGDPAYTAGLTAGHQCVQLSMRDGGLNDADGIADGVIKDPGGVSVIVTVTIELGDVNTPSTYGNNSGEQLVMSFVIESNTNDAVINRLVLSSAGTMDEVNDIAQVSLYSDMNNDGNPDMSTPLATGVYTADNGTIEFTFTSPGPYALPLGRTQLLVYYTF